LISNPASLWWDDVTTNDHAEPREEILTAAFRKAVSVLAARFGRDARNWTWGKLHTLEYMHPLGRIWPLNLIFNAGPYPAGGNYSQVDAMASARGEETFAVISGPSTRQNRRLREY
jgi:penicillin amidase